MSATMINAKTTTATFDHAPLIEAAFERDFDEGCYRVEGIEGRIPDFIQGTYYLNGPGKFRCGTLNYRNWLDGDGMVSAVRFDRGGVHCTSRFVRTEKFIAETALDQPVYRAFGTAFPGDRIKRGIMTASPHNVSVACYQGALLAFGEQSLPQELDPVSLETLGTFDFGGQLNEVSPFSAHPKIDQCTGELFNFGVSLSRTQPCLNYYRFDARARLVCRKRILIDYPSPIHDFALGERHAVFYLCPYVLDMDRLASQGQATIDALDWRPEAGSRLIVVGRDDGELRASIRLDGRYSLHTINCFETGSRLVVDLIEYERPLYDQYQPLPELFVEVPAGRPTRFVIDLDRGELCEKRTVEYPWAPDFPIIDPRQECAAYDDFWMLGISAAGRPGRKFFDRLVRARWSRPGEFDIYRAAEQQYLGGEAAFVPKPGCSAAGVIICPSFDARHLASEILIFDALHLSAGPVARLRLKSPIRLAFHSTFWQVDRSAEMTGFAVCFAESDRSMVRTVTQA